MAIIPYDPRAAVEYARLWALRRNPAYADFENLGGDCTNFVSQCLFAGAGMMNFTPVYGWYYRTLSDRAPAWSSVRYLHRFLVHNEGPGPRAHELSWRAIQPGDVVQLGDSQRHFYHAALITQVQPSILVCAHTIDSLDRPLDSYNYANIRFLHIYGVGTP